MYHILFAKKLQFLFNQNIIIHYTRLSIKHIKRIYTYKLNN